MYDGIQAYGGVKVSIYNMMYKKRDNLRIYYSNFFGKKNHVQYMSKYSFFVTDW